jgi:hypothetical protein
LSSARNSRAALSEHYLVSNNEKPTMYLGFYPVFWSNGWSGITVQRQTVHAWHLIDACKLAEVDLDVNSEGLWFKVVD